ncbi:MAG: hypothetical protein HZB98_10720, partial [Bacteroidia bacterium]|nr:hypothetical protein [Bacteroidia bacterium]
MKNLLRIFITILFISSLLLFPGGCNKKQHISLDNGRMMIAFDIKTGAIVKYRCLNDSILFYEENLPPFSPWEIDLQDSNKVQTIDISDALKFNHRKPNDSTLILEWKKFLHPQNKNLRVTATVSLRGKKTMSLWHISLNGTAGILVNKVAFPRIKISESEGDEYLAIPEWMGQIIKNPRGHLSSMKGPVKKYEWSYPGPLSMQCAALYTPGKRGFYAACNDTLAYRKNLAFTLDSSRNLIYQMNHFPAADPSADRYEPQYSSIIGSFTGDWITAAEIYREWGSNQKWSRESRFITGQTPEWLEKTALWVWNRGRSSNVLVPASDLQKTLNMPVSVFWHWWHGCSYDDGFPEYIPPREGKTSFINAMSEANKKEINAIVYMNQALWGTTTDSWKNENAEKFAAKDSKGNTLTHLFNIFTGKPTAYMCMGTQFWKDKYSTLC